MTCPHAIEVTREHVPAKRKPGCRRRNPLVVVLDCELYGRVTPRPAADDSLPCCQGCQHHPDRPTA